MIPISLYSLPNGVTTLIRIFIFILCLLLPVSVSFAQEAGDSGESQTYDPTFSGHVNEAEQAVRQQQQKMQAAQGFITPQSVNVSLVHPSYMDEDQFGIEMSVPDMISGCYELTPLEYEAKFVDPYFLDIRVKKYRRIAPEGINAAQKCDQQNKMSTAMMVLDRKDLEKRGTQEIRFSADAGADTYKIVLSDTHVELIPASMMVFQGVNLAGPLKDRLIYSFASDSMIVLQIPMAQADEDLTPQILHFAKSYALAPVNPESPASWDGNGRAMYYFHDRDGQLSPRIGPDGYAQVGTIKANRPYDGPNGRTETAVDLTVYVTRPGTEL